MYKSIEEMPYSSEWITCKKKALSGVQFYANKMHTCARIHFIPQPANETFRSIFKDVQTW